MTTCGFCSSIIWLLPTGSPIRAAVIVIVSSDFKGTAFCDEACFDARISSLTERCQYEV